MAPSCGFRSWSGAVRRPNANRHQDRHQHNYGNDYPELDTHRYDDGNPLAHTAADSVAKHIADVDDNSSRLPDFDGLGNHDSECRAFANSDVISFGDADSDNDSYGFKDSNGDGNCSGNTDANPDGYPHRHTGSAVPRRLRRRPRRYDRGSCRCRAQRSRRSAIDMRRRGSRSRRDGHHR